MAKKFELLSKRYKAAKVVLGGTVAAGDWVNSGDLYGFYLVDGVSGDIAALIYESEMVRVEKASGQAWVVGEPVYYHTTNLNVTNVSTGAVLCGYVAEAALSAAVLGFITFDGSLTFAKA